MWSEMCDRVCVGHCDCEIAGGSVCVAFFMCYSLCVPLSAALISLDQTFISPHFVCVSVRCHCVCGAVCVVCVCACVAVCVVCVCAQ